MNASPLLSELIVIREWLQEAAPPPQHPEATTGYWKFTKHSVMQSLRTGNGQRDGLVKELDPDAVNREEGKSLAADDAVSAVLLANGSNSDIGWLFFRIMKRLLCKRCMHTCEREDLKKQLSSAERHTNHGGLLVFVAPSSSNGERYVSAVSLHGGKR